MIEVYKDGDTFAIKTDAVREDDFFREISELLSDLIRKGSFMGFPSEETSQINASTDEESAAKTARIVQEVLENDWEFQFGYILPLVVEICCKLRGDKSTVAEKRMLLAGTVSPGGNLLVGAI